MLDFEPPLEPMLEPMLESNLVVLVRRARVGCNGAAGEEHFH